MSFAELLSGRGRDALLKFIEDKGFSAPSPIQSAVIPLFSSNKDVAVEACTGSGKTLAYLLPIFLRLLRIAGEPDSRPQEMFWVHSVILAPTRELVLQIHGVAREVLDAVQNFDAELLPTCRIVELSGGRKPKVDWRLVTQAAMTNSLGILVSTPGRLLSQVLEGRQSTLQRERQWTFRATEFLVIDEADKVFSEVRSETEVRQCIAILPKQRRTGVFSATLMSETRALLHCGMRNPHVIKLAIENAAPLPPALEASTADAPDAEAADAEAADAEAADAEAADAEAADAETDAETDAEVKAAEAASSDDCVSDDDLSSESAVSEVDVPEVEGEVVEGGVRKHFDPDEGSDEEVAVISHFMPIGLRNYYLFAEQDERLPVLFRLMESADYFKILVFTTTCAAADFTHLILSSYYSKCGYAQILKLHGKLERGVRQKALIQFSENERVKSEAGDIRKRVLIASDLAARGIDFQGIDLIVQMDPPNDPSQTFHRMGRTARAGGRGDTLLLISSNESSFLTFMASKGVTFSESFNIGAGLASRIDQVDTEKLPKLLPADPAQIKSHVHGYIQSELRSDRWAYERAKDAFASHIRAYKEHQLAFIFEFKHLDVGRVANRFGLFKIPFLKELKTNKVFANTTWPNFIGAEVDERLLQFKSSAAKERYEEAQSRRRDKRALLKVKLEEARAKRAEMMKAKKSASARRKRKRSILHRELVECDTDFKKMKRHDRQMRLLKSHGRKLTKEQVADFEIEADVIINETAT